MKIYGLQFDIAWEARETNHQRLRKWLVERPVEPGSLVVFPELTCSGFTQKVELAESLGGETEGFYQQLAREFDVTVVGGVIERGATGKGRNVALAVTPDGVKARYCKIHPFTFGGETEYFEKGEEIVTFPWTRGTETVQVALTVCYDLRFPELFRAVAGVEVYLVIANWPAPRDKHWMSLLQARAIENQAYVVGVNRCGQDPKNHYSGRSQIIDPQGVVVADALSQEGFIEAELDLVELRAYRSRFPALTDRRDFSELRRLT